MHRHRVEAVRACCGDRLLQEGVGIHLRRAQAGRIRETAHQDAGTWVHRAQLGAHAGKQRAVLARVRRVPERSDVLLVPNLPDLDRVGGAAAARPEAASWPVTARGGCGEVAERRAVRHGERRRVHLARHVDEDGLERDIAQRSLPDEVVEHRPLRERSV